MAWKNFDGRKKAGGGLAAAPIIAASGLIEHIISQFPDILDETRSMLA